MELQLTVHIRPTVQTGDHDDVRHEHDRRLCRLRNHHDHLEEIHEQGHDPVSMMIHVPSQGIT